MLYLSKDEGENWYQKITLEEVDPGKGSFSYPSLIQSANGLIHLSYSYQKESKNKSIKHVVLDPARWP